MSLSSLQQQLNQFKQKQKADPKLPDNASATFLFDFRTASGIDKEAIFSIGYSGMKELARIDKKFIKYFEKLFNNTSKYFQRETKMKSELEEIDTYLENLIIDLIDYFHLKSSHKVIEYLIKIFNINAYNPKFLALAFLPFHETKYYVKLLQNLNLELNQNFKFLMHFSKSGTVLLEELLYKEILNNFDLTKEVFNFFEEKIIENSKKSLEAKKKGDFPLYESNYNLVNESEKYFKFLIKLIKYFLENLVNNKKIDKTNFFILVVNFIRTNIKHFSLLNDLGNMKQAANYGSSYIFSADIRNNSQNENQTDEINYIINEVCQLIILINSKYKLTKEYANALLNDILNNFLFFKNTKNFNSANGHLINSNNKKSAEFVLTSILLFVNDFEEQDNQSKNSSLILDKETLEYFFQNIKGFDLKTNSINKKNYQKKSESKTHFANILENLSNEFNFFPFLKLILNSILMQIDQIFTEAENENNTDFSSFVEKSKSFESLINYNFQTLKFVKIQRSEVFKLCEYLLNLDDKSKTEVLLESLEAKINLSKNKTNFREELIQSINKIVQKAFIQLENFYTEDFNAFLINLFEVNKKNIEKSPMIKHLKGIENYKLLSSNEDYLFDLFINLNTTNVNSVASSLERIDTSISENKIEIVKFTFNAVMAKFANFEQEFILRKILDMRNFKVILNQLSANNDKQVNYKTEFLEFYFKIYEEKISLYSNEFLEKLNLFILGNFINEPNDGFINKFFIYKCIFALNIPEEKLDIEIYDNNFIYILIRDDIDLEKKIEELAKNSPASNSIELISHIFCLLKVLIQNKSLSKKYMENIILLINQIHLYENAKFKQNNSTSVYLELIKKIIEILNYVNFEFYNYKNNAKNNKSNNNAFTINILEDLLFEVSDNLISNILFHKDFLNSISHIAFLILNSQTHRIKALFDKIINFVYEVEFFHFMTYIILNNKSSLFESIREEITNDLFSEMNFTFTINILDYLSIKLFNFDEIIESNSKINLDFGFILTLICLLNENKKDLLLKKLLEIFDKLNSHRNYLNISFTPFNSLFGFIASEANSNKNKKFLLESKSTNNSELVMFDIIKLVSEHKNEILINNNNLPKLLNNSRNIDFNLFIMTYDYFIAYSDKFSDFEIFYKIETLFRRKLDNDKSKQLQNRKENILNFNVEIYDHKQIEYILDTLFIEDLKSNQNSKRLQESVVGNILEYFDNEENCLALVIQKLLETNKIDQEALLSENLIRKIAQSKLLEKIDFTKTSKNSKSANDHDLKNSSSKKTNNRSSNALNFVDFIKLLMQYNISSADITNILKVDYIEVLAELLVFLKTEISQNENSCKHNKDKSHLQTHNNNLEIREIIFFVFEIILKQDNCPLALALQTLEFLETLGNNGEIDSNFLVMANNLHSFLTNANSNSDENSHSQIKSICKKTENVILQVCENLAKKEKNQNENFYIRNINKTFSTNVYEQVEKMVIEEDKEDDDEYQEFGESSTNAMNYSYEYLNILNTLFLSLNKSIVFFNKEEFERNLVLRVINKTFDIFYANSKKIENKGKEDYMDKDLEIENEIGYKFKKDIFSVILNSIINFITSLLGNRNFNEEADLLIFYEYIQTLVKLSIKNLNDDVYLDNILKKFCGLIKPFDNRLISCLFSTVYYYSIENNFLKNLAKKEKNGNATFIEQFSKFYDNEKENNNYYDRIISSYFEEILEFNYQKFDVNSVAKVLLILEEILGAICIEDKDNNINHNIFFILRKENEDYNNEKNSICFFENLRNLLLNLSIKILTKIKNLFYLNDSKNLKQNEDIYSIVISINNKILKNYKLSNQILNKNKENKNAKIYENYEETLILTNVFNKNLKTFEDNLFEIIIESNIIHYLIINIFNKIEDEKEQILLRNFLLRKYLLLIKSDSESIQETSIISKNASKSKKKAKNFEHFQAKYNDNLIVFETLLKNFDKENSKNYENINFIFSVLSEIITFTEKFRKFNQAGKSGSDVFNIMKESKRLDLIISSLVIENNKNNDYNLSFSLYNCKFSIFSFVIKFFTVFELKFFDLFNKFIKNFDSFFDVLFFRFFFCSNNFENKDILMSFLKNFFELVNSKSEYMSPIIESVIFKISLLYEENFTSEIINKIFDILAKRQLFDLSFKAVKYAFKNFDTITDEKTKTKDIKNLGIEKHSYSNLLSNRAISNKINSILTYFNTAIKHSDKLVITDMNLKIIKFIYRILIDKNYNNINNSNININNNKKTYLLNKKGNSEIEEENQNDEFADKFSNHSENILVCLRSLILKMNEKQFKLLFEEFLFAFFKEEIDLKNPDDLEIEKVGNKYKLNNCIVSLQIFNEIFECLNSIFVSYFEKYKNVLIQILNHVNSVFCSANKNNSKKKKDRSHFEEKYDSENNTFSYLNLSNLVMKNISLALKYDKSVLMQETIQDFFEPVVCQVIYKNNFIINSYFCFSINLNFSLNLYTFLNPNSKNISITL